MLASADTLETIKNESVGDGNQQGKAIEKLKDSIGDAHEKLREAGELYEPVGPVITAYGTALDGCQPTINNSADDCVDKWATYESLPGDEDGSTSPEAGGGVMGMGGYDADSPEAIKKAAENGAKQVAYDHWLESAEAFDGGYDSWELAFDDAVDGISDGLSGSIKDSRWANIVDFLEVAALIVGVAALIIAGPLMAALALAVGALLLISTIMAYKNGERSGTDIAFATLGAIPLCKVTSVTKLMNLGAGSTKTIARTATGIKALDGAVAQGSKLLRGEQVFHKSGLVGIFKNRGATAGFRQLFTGSPNGFKSFYRGQKKLYQGLEFENVRDLAGVRRLARVDQAVTLFSTTGRNLNYANLSAGQFGGGVPTFPKSPFVKFAS
ncbi:MAG: hypothetical protein H0X12_03175 [Nocardioides sp.]|nr:hypothetical protein [Nocardioides sp.]